MEVKSIKKIDDDSPWLTTREAAAYLKLNPGTLRNYLRGGVIPHYIGPGTMTKRFLKSELDEWMKQGYQGPQRRLQQPMTSKKTPMISKKKKTPSTSQTETPTIKEVIHDRKTD